MSEPGFTWHIHLMNDITGIYASEIKSSCSFPLEISADHFCCFFHASSPAFAVFVTMAPRAISAMTFGITIS